MKVINVSGEKIKPESAKIIELQRDFYSLIIEKQITKEEAFCLVTNVFISICYDLKLSEREFGKHCDYLIEKFCKLKAGDTND